MTDELLSFSLLYIYLQDRASLSLFVLPYLVPYKYFHLQLKKFFHPACLCYSHPHFDSFQIIFRTKLSHSYRIKRHKLFSNFFSCFLLRKHKFVAYLFKYYSYIHSEELITFVLLGRLSYQLETLMNYHSYQFNTE